MNEHLIDELLERHDRERRMAWNAGFTTGIGTAIAVGLFVCSLLAGLA